MTGGRIILPPTNPSLDSNGKPVSGSTLTYYQNNTTTLVSIYSDKALTVPLANPLTSDSAGVFPQVWASNTAGYSVKWTRTGFSDVTFNDIFPDLDSSAVGTYVSLNQSQVSLGTNIATAFGTVGVGLIENAFTQTDSTTGAGTIATAYASVFNAVTFATPANAITITKGYGLYLKDPVAGSHVTLTNKFALGVDSLEVGGNGSTLAVPTRQVLTSGSAATYTTPANCRQLRVRMVGGGGGGGGKAGDTNGTSGGNSIFNSVVAAGGGGGTNGGAGALGGSGGSGSPTGIARKRGAAGTAGGKANSTIITSNSGGTGGGEGGGPSGTAAAANTGGGGGGAIVSGVGSETQAGPGGGQGEIVEFLINTPAATYTYTIGAGSAGGTSAGAGGTGVIIVDEFY